jgi:hypothetical protein
MYTLSFSAFIVGVLILAAGVAFMRWHQWVADNFGGGVGSYERYKFWALVTCVLGLIVMVNLHDPILRWLVSWLLP